MTINLNKEKYNIICLSNQLWDYPNWTNKRHVMTRLGKLGHNVLFVDPPINFGRLLLKQILRGHWGIFRIFTSIKKDGNVTIFTPRRLPNFLPKSIMSFISSFFTWKFIYQINILVSKFPKNQKTILWIYNMEIDGLQYFLDNLKYDFLIYDCVDYYAGFPRYSEKHQKEKILSIENSLTKRSDIVFATAPGLLERLKKINPNTYYTPNVGDYEMFKNVRKRFGDKVPPKLSGIKKPIIGYVGALDTYKFDYALLKECAEFYPDFSFVVIGDIALKDREGTIKELGFENIGNIHFLGSIPFLKTPEYLAQFDVELIPYVYNDYTIGGCFPVKFFNTLSAGIPSVVTDLPVFSMYKNVAYVSKTHDDFIKNIKKALDENTKSKEEERILVAKVNTWDSKVENMLTIISNHLEKKLQSDPELFNKVRSRKR